MLDTSCNSNFKEHAPNAIDTGHFSKEKNKILKWTMGEIIINAKFTLPPNRNT